MFKILRDKMFKRNIEPYEINIEELKIKQKEGAEIVDVRSSQEYQEGHIAGAINIPYYEINRSVENVLKDKNKEIVLYCQAGVRGKQAYKKLMRLNYRHVYNLYKGLDNYD